MISRINLLKILIFDFLEHTFYNSPAFRGSAFAPLALRANCLSQPLQSGLGFYYEKRQLLSCGTYSELKSEK